MLTFNAETLGAFDRNRAERMLADLANVPDTPPVDTNSNPLREQWQAEYRRLQTEWSKLPESSSSPNAMTFIITGQTWSWVDRMQERYPETFSGLSIYDMFALRHLLRAAWDDPDRRRREWFCFRLRQFHANILRREALRRDPAKMLVDADLKQRQLTNILALEHAAESLIGLMDHEAVQEEFRQREPPALNEFEAACFYFQQGLSYALHCRNPECTMPYFFNEDSRRRYCSDECANWGQRNSKKGWWDRNKSKKSSRKRGKRNVSL